MDEEWRDIKEFGGRYRVSNQGRVMSLNGLKTLKPFLHEGSYRTRFINPNVLHRHTMRSIARLVLEAFCPTEYPHLKGVRYLNDDPSDCRLENLQWQGHSKPQTALTDDKVRAIRSRWMGGESYLALARSYNVNKETISKVINGVSWRHVS